MQTPIVAVTSLRPQLLKHISRVNRLGQELIITKNGKPSAVLIGFDEWESWKETMEILANPKLLRRIKKGRAYFRRGGKGKTIADLFGK